jgi:hypothetical protein
MIHSGQKAVATAGSAEQVDTDNSVRDYFVRADPGNTGVIYLGGDDVSSTTGLILKADDPPIRLRGKLSQLFVDVETSGEKVTWMAVSIE